MQDIVKSVRRKTKESRLAGRQQQTKDRIVCAISRSLRGIFLDESFIKKSVKMERNTPGATLLLPLH